MFNKNEKVCFVVMGFGKKTDYQTGTVVDLDLIYDEVIKPLFATEFPDFKLIRGDECLTSGFIDMEMYQLLLNAELVIADITTHNDNALYELGIRHALRPASTIVIAQKDLLKEYPFDINHIRIFSYDDINNSNDLKITAFKNKLKSVILRCQKEKQIDSPIYTLLTNLQPPEYKINEESIQPVSDFNSKLSDRVGMIINAKDAMVRSDFSAAIPIWRSLHKDLPNYSYITQQLALATYKSEKPTVKAALMAAWKIINELPLQKTLDTETLGIAGAICKRLYVLENLVSDKEIWLKRATEFYRKGFDVVGNYYTGENYANCLLLQMEMCPNNDETYITINYIRKKVCEKIIDILQKNEEKGVFGKWESATMSNCFLHLGEQKKAEKYQKIFLCNRPSQWEEETFFATKKKIIEILGISNEEGEN